MLSKKVRFAALGAAVCGLVLPSVHAAPRLDCGALQRLVDHSVSGDGFAGVVSDVGGRRSSLTIASAPFRDCRAVRSRETGKVYAICDVIKSDDRAGKPADTLAPPAYFAALNKIMVDAMDGLSACVGSEPKVTESPSLDPVIGNDATDLVATWAMRSSKDPTKPVALRLYFVLPKKNTGVEMMREFFSGYVSIDGQLR